MLLALAVAAGAGATVAPADASTLTVHATFAGTHGTSRCSRTSCPVSGTSVTCFEGGVNGTTAFPYSGGCSATLRGSVLATVVQTPDGPVSVCAPTGSAVLTFNDGYGMTVSLPAALALTNGVAHFTTPDLVTIGGAVYAGHGEGDVVTPCGAGEGVTQPFAGTFHYVRV